MHTSPTSLSGVSTDTRTSSMPLPAEAMPGRRCRPPRLRRGRQEGPKSPKPKLQTRETPVHRAGDSTLAALFRTPRGQRDSPSWDGWSEESRWQPATTANAQWTLAEQSASARARARSSLARLGWLRPGPALGCRRRRPTREAEDPRPGWGKLWFLAPGLPPLARWPL